MRQRPGNMRLQLRMYPRYSIALGKRSFGSAKSVRKSRPFDFISVTVNRSIFWFIKCTGLVLLITAIAKVVAGFGHDRILLRPDPILVVSFRTALFIAALAEVIIAGICLLSDYVKLQLILIAWLATCFSIYRFGIWSASVGYCPCLGSIPDALHISTHTANVIALCISLFLLVGSYGGLIAKWITNRVKS